MLFKDIPGQMKVKQNLLSDMKEGRLPHAVLFQGKTGYGSFATALAVAQYLQCDNPGKEDSCGTCPHCLKNQKLLHPDVHFTFPTIGSKMTSDMFIKEWREAVIADPFVSLKSWIHTLKSENKLPNITKVECQNILKKLNLKAFSGKNKVHIIFLAEFLGKEGNRLLKLIEEPPEHTHFILVTEQGHKILNTIRSRCQLYKFPPLTDEALGEYISQQNITGDLDSLIFLAQGDINNLRDIKIDNEGGYMPIFLTLFRASYAKRVEDIIPWVEQMAKRGRDEQIQFCQYVLQLMEEILRFNMTQNEDLIRMPEGDIGQIIKIAKVVDFDQITQISTLFDKITYYINRNAHPKMLFLDLALKLNKIFKKIPLVQHS